MARILVIDDEEGIRNIIEEMLAEAGHEVFVAADGREGLTIVGQRHPELIITDIFMPEKDGLAVIMEVAHEAGVRIIAISGGGQQKALEYLRHAKYFGAWRVLPKPFTEDELLETVNAVLADPGRSAAR